MFYDKFKQLCEQKGVSCNKAALEMGLSNATPTTWKKRGLTPKGETLTKIADYFGVTTDYLLSDNSTPTMLDVFTGKAAFSETILGKEKAPTPEGGRELPHAAHREVLAGKGVRIMLDADAKLTEAQLEDIINFIEFQQEKNGR